MHRIVLRSLLISLLSAGAVALAQDNKPAPAAASAANPLSAHSKVMYFLKAKAAEKMPEENYGFKPTESVRSFGQVLGHVADSQYAFCSKVLGEKNPAPNVEQTKSSKADLIAALKDAFAYCDRAHAGMTDASGAEMIKVMGRDTPKLGALNINNTHTVEHYGNLVTYLRMKNIVPPSSDPEFMKEMMKN